MSPGPSDDRIGEHLFRGYSGRIFIVIALGTLVANLGRQALPPLLPTIIEGLVITPAAAGFALTLMRISFAVFQYPSGRIADAVTRKIAVMIGLLGMIVGFTILTQVSTYAVLLASTALLGIGSAFFFVSERVLLSDLFVQNRGSAFGMNSAISRIGSILAAGLAIVALEVGRWQTAFIPVVGLLLVTVGLFHYSSREGYAVQELFTVQFQGEVQSSVRRVFGVAEIRWLVVVYTLVIFAWEGLLSFLPTFLQVEKGFSPAFASGGFAALFAIGIIVQPLSGRMSDRWDRRVVAGVATLVSAIGLIVLVGATVPVLIVLGIVLYAGGVMAFTPVLQAYLMDVFPDEHKGGDFGAFKTVYEGLSSLGPTYVGVMAGIASYTTAFTGFLACFGGGAAILFWLKYGHHP